jgi:hypothetical protein
MKRIAFVALPAALLFASFGARAEGAGPITVEVKPAQAATATATAQPAAKPANGMAMKATKSSLHQVGV